MRSFERFLEKEIDKEVVEGKVVSVNPLKE